MVGEMSGGASPSLKVRTGIDDKKRRLSIKNQLDQFIKDSQLNTLGFTSMDDFTEMKKIEQEFGSLDLGHTNEPLSMSFTGDSNSHA